MSVTPPSPIDLVNALLTISQMKADIQNMKSNISSLQSDNSNLKSQVSSLQTANSGLNNQISAITNKITSAQNDIASAQSTLSTVKSTADSALSKANSTANGLTQSVQSIVNKNYVLGMVQPNDILSKLGTPYPSVNSVLGAWDKISQIQTMLGNISDLQNKVSSANIKSMINGDYIKGFIDATFVKGKLDPTWLLSQMPTQLQNIPSDILTTLSNAKNFKAKLPTINIDLGTFMTNLGTYAAAFKDVIDEIKTMGDDATAYTSGKTNLVSFTSIIVADVKSLAIKVGTLRNTLDALSTPIQSLRSDFT